MSKLAHILTIVVAVVIVFGVSAIPADAGNVYLTSSEETLYRVTEGGGMESFTFDRSIRAMHRDTATGNVWMLADWPANKSGESRLRLLHNPFSGTPSWTEYAVLNRQYGSLTQAEGNWYALSEGALYGLDISDPNNPIETYIGSTGHSGTGGSGYDPVTQTMYLTANHQGVPALYTMDLETAGTTYIGDLGVNDTNYGAEWIGGQLYVALQNLSSGDLEIGTTDTSTGLYSALLSVAPAQTAAATALTGIPEPGMLSLVLVGGTVLLRRRS
jgi:hypothetical protein